MSEEREKLMKGTEDAEETTEDVEAHVRGGRDADVRGGRDAAEDESGDDVEAHVKGGRMANDDEGDDDVEAHVKAGR